jgi:hypothetical protein
MRVGGFLHIKNLKIKGVPFKAPKAYKWIRGITPLILILGIRWRREVNFTSRLLCPWERNPAHTDQEVVWAPEPVWTVWRRDKTFVPVA